MDNAPFMQVYQAKQNITDDGRNCSLWKALWKMQVNDPSHGSHFHQGCYEPHLHVVEEGRQARKDVLVPNLSHGHNLTSNELDGLLGRLVNQEPLHADHVARGLELPDIDDSSALALAVNAKDAAKAAMQHNVIWIDPGANGIHGGGGFQRVRSREPGADTPDKLCLECKMSMTTLMRISRHF